MIRLLPSLRQFPSAVRCFSSVKPDATETKPWENPWKHAVPQQETTRTGYEELSVDWKYVERLMPHEVIPELPKHESYPTPSGWRAPQSPPPELPYYVQRKADHTFALYLERRRDQLNEKTLDFDYVELVSIRRVDGDVFAFDQDLRSYLEEKLQKPIATHVDELKGRIKVRGADRSLIEQFLFEKGF